MRMMDAMRRNPTDRTALQRERGEKRRRVLDRFREHEAAVGQGPVKAERHADTARDVPEREHHRDGGPTERAGNEDQEHADVDDPESDADRPIRGFHLYTV